MKVCIDAGHHAACVNGSPDGSYYEHEFALDLAKRIKAALLCRGVGVVMTREDGRDVSLAKRCTIANTAQANLFVSLHSNAAPIETWSEANGWECYILAKGGQAEKAAQYIHDASIPFLGLQDRGIKTAKYAVLEDTAMPAVLIEHGFHNNKADVELLKSDAFRDKCAEADARGICAYLGIAYDAERYISVDELRKMGYAGVKL